MGAHMQSLERPPVLFCNVLGQLALLRQDFHNDKPWRAAFRQSIEPLPWASYHDRASCHGPKKDAALQSSWETPDEMSLTDAATRLQWRFPLELEDHGTAGLLPPGPRAYALWPLTADSTHLIEWAQSLPNNEDASPKTQ